MTNATNVTIQYMVSSSSGFNWAYTNVSWGPNQSYPYRAETNQWVNNAGTYTNVLIDYLNPSTTSYFSFVGWAYCIDNSGHQYIYRGTGSGQWTTGSEQTYYNQWGITIRGTVRDPNGGNPGANLFVMVACTAGTNSYGTTTGSRGSFVIDVWNWLGQPACTAVGANYAVEVANWPVSLGGSGVSGQWKNRWNETVVVPAPQFVNFYLPLDYTSGYIPTTYDFTNSSNVLFSVSSQSTFTTSESRSLSIQGAIDGFSGSYGTYTDSATSTTFQSTIAGVQGRSFYMAEQFLTSGTEVFNGISRTLNFFPTYFEATGNYSSGATGTPDWMPRPACGSQPGVVFCDWRQSSSPSTYSMTQGGSATLSSNFNVGVSVPIDIPGIGDFTSGISDSYTTGLTSATSFTVGFSYTYPNPNLCYGYEYVFEGDNSGTYGVVVHVWNLGTQSSCP
jgi:hypothetical protein